MRMNITLIGAGKGDELHLSGAEAGNEGVVLGKGQVDGFYEAPTETIWSRARRQRGGTFRGLENPEREMSLGFHVSSTRSESWEEVFARLRDCFTYHLDPWWPEDELAKLTVETESGYRELPVQLASEPEFKPDTDPNVLDYGNIIVALKAAQPFWDGGTVVSSWEGTGSGVVEVANPTDVTMYHEWILDPGIWTLPDFSWLGAPGKRAPGGDHATRTLELNQITYGQVRIRLDPMERTFTDSEGTNVAGQVAGGYSFMHAIPPRTPKTELPVSVSGPPSAGVQLRQPRLWSGVWS